MGRNATKLLEAAEHPVDAVAILRWNDRPDPMDQEFLAQLIAVISSVGKKQSRFADWYRQQVRNGIVVRSLAACQDEAKRAPLTVCSGVDFRRKAAA
ncbi:hypothetical protein QWE_07601 [Agrobacterium albertimagni AOL15]|uniref:Uncharacterized protein n=1 Tax=Agrobacterium albertimagni AOL15 TaxID=1156935 RepID=K2QX36_9HYPH|nr:hypothetical protein QWE_07601 [Agrobacterium albertimagni AOL15]